MKFNARITRIACSLIKIKLAAHNVAILTTFSHSVQQHITPHIHTFRARNHDCRSDSFEGFRTHHFRAKFDIPGINYLKYRRNLREYRDITISRYRKKSASIKTMHK